MTTRKHSEAVQLPKSIRLPEPLAITATQFDHKLAARPAALYRPVPMGFDTLDYAFSGGLHPTDLTLIVGRQNVGKTIFISQIASNIALWAARNKYPIVPWICCYEHDEWSLFTRLLCMESWKYDPENPLTYEMIVDAIIDVKENYPDEKDIYSRIIEKLPVSAARAVEAISHYFEHLSLYYGARNYLSVEYIEVIIEEYEKRHGKALIPIIDYLQTIPPDTKLIHRASEPAAMHLIIKRNLEALKGLCIKKQIPILVVAAVDKLALTRPGPVHIEDVLGPEETNYTIDSAIVLNHDVIYGGSISDADERKATIRISVEKNRRGPVPLEWRHRFVGGSFYIDTIGETVSSQESYQNSRVNVKERQ